MATLAAPAFSGVQTGISPAELSQRIAVLKRFKELLKAQRDRFRSYLDTLDRQQDLIQKGSTDDLIRHVELEEKIVEDIFSIQKVIDPLEAMYQSVKIKGSAGNAGEDEVAGLKETLKSLKDEAAVRSGQNRELLAKRMAELRMEINSLKNNPYNKLRSSFGNSPAPIQIDIKG